MKLVLLALAISASTSAVAAPPALVPPVVPPVVTPGNIRVDATKATTLPVSPVTQPSGELRTVAPTAVLRIASSPDGVPTDNETFTRARKAIERGLAFLGAAQTTRGTWFEGEEVEPTDMEPRHRAASVAVTAMALKAFAQAGDIGDIAVRTRARNAIALTLADPKAMEAVSTGGMGNYVMSSVASGLATVGDADAMVGAQRAIRWLAESQWDEAEGIDASKDWYGGAGYGNGKRPDLSNTQMMLDAMHDAGVSPDEPAVQRALAFVSRTQNRKESNPAAWAQHGANDGGFVYSPANGGESMSSEAAGEGRYGEKLAAKSLRSYGSMTYAGLKSMLYAGLSPDDPRVKDALGWIAAHFTFAENPGLGQQGYFYYIHAMARALQAARVEKVADVNGTQHAWRSELVDALVQRQREDGSWRNSVERWEESKEQLATIYAVLALEEAIKPMNASSK